MRVYNQIKDLMCDELEHIARKGELTHNNLEVIDKAVDIIKDIDTINAMQEYIEGNSYDEHYMRGEGYSRMYPVLDGYSFERGRQRDSMGRYSGRGNSMDGYYAGGSNTKEELQRLMDKATNETEKEAIRVAIESMNN